MNRTVPPTETLRARSLFSGTDDAAARELYGVTLPSPRSAEQARIGYLVSLFAIDCLCIMIGFTAASAIRLGSPIEEQGLRTIAVVLPMFIAVAFHNSAYSLEALERPSVGIRRSMQALLYACAVAIAVLFYLKWSAQFSRLVFGVGTLTSLVALAAARWSFGQHVGRKHRWTFRTRLVIVDSVTVTPHRGDCIVFADQLGIAADEDDPWIKHRLGEMLERFDSVVLACPPERRSSWAHSLQGCAADVELLMPELSHLGGVELRTLHGERTLVISSCPLRLGDRLLKRAVDLIVAGCALILLSPVMLLVAIAIKIDTPGPVLFRQRRVGQNNRMFELLKFRSMQAETSDPDGGRSTARVDERVTAVGRFIRRSSMDELPQLFNVIAGEMSIVGPRPHALGSTAEDLLFWHIDRRYFQRHAIKPGITGLAQVRGLRGATACTGDLTNRLQSDLEYVTGWSVWRDLKIIAATFLVLVHPSAF